MARTTLGSLVDRVFRNELNRMLEELYDNIFLFKDGTGFIESEHINDGAITNIKLSNNSVSRDKIENNAINQDKIANDAVSQNKIQNNAINENKLADHSVSNNKLKDNAVNLKKLSIVRQTRNLFDGNFIQGFGYFKPTVDGFPEGFIQVSRASHPRAAVVKIEKNTEYTITIFEGGDNFRVALINEIPHENNVPLEVLKTELGEQGSDYRVMTINNDVDAEYIFVMTNSESSLKAKLQIEKGIQSSDYLPNAYIPNEYLDPIIYNDDFKRVIDVEDTNLFKRNIGNNLFSGFYTHGYGFFLPQEDFPHGFIRSTRTETTRAAIVKIDKGSTYTITKHSGGDRFNIALLRERPSSLNMPLKILYAYRGEDTSGRQSHTVENDVGANYIYVHTNQESEEYAELQIEEGTESSFYHQGAYIPKEYIDPNIFEEIELPPNDGDVEVHIADKDHKFNFSGNFHQTYEHPIIENVVKDVGTIKTSAVNAMFSDLTDIHSDIGVKTLLGADESGENIYMFESIPSKIHDAPYSSLTRPDDGKPMNIPKIFITGGIHGNEKSPPLSMYYLLKTLWENPNADPNIDSLVQNVHFVFIPVVGPEGYDNATYSNGSNNLNRNFPPHGNANKLATQYIMSVLDNHNDMDFFIDFHNMNARDGMLGYVLTNDDLWKRIGTNIYKDIGMKWSKNDDSIPKDRRHKFSVATVANDGTIGRYVQDIIGKPSGLLEVPRSHPFKTDAEEFDEPIIRLGVDILFNAIYSSIRSKQ